MIHPPSAWPARIADSIRTTLAEYHGVEVTAGMADRMAIRITSNLLDEYHFDPLYEDNEGVAFFVREGLKPAVGLTLNHRVAVDRAANVATALALGYRISWTEDTVPMQLLPRVGGLSSGT